MTDDASSGPQELQAAHSLLALQQLTDSAFPSGAFSHSYGLEQLAREHLIYNRSELEGFVTSVLHLSLATSDAPAAASAALETCRGATDGVVAIDRAFLRTRAAAETRLATLLTGRRLLEEVGAHIDTPLLNDYRARVKGDSDLGSYPVGFGVVCASLRVEANQIAPAFMLGAITGLLQAAMRLMPVSHRDVQSILHTLRPQIATLAARIEPTSAPILFSFNPLQEIASMRHAVGGVRLFAS